MDPITENYAFIDGQNLHLGVRDIGWIIDYKKFRIYLKEKYNVEKAFYFIGYNDTQENLYASLKKDGFELIFKPTHISIDGTLKGNCDAELVMHCILEIENYNKAVIVANDGDYYSLIKYLRENRKLRTVLVPNTIKMSKLIPEASLNQFSSLENVMDKIGYAKI